MVINLIEIRFVLGQLPPNTGRPTLLPGNFLCNLQSALLACIFWAGSLGDCQLRIPLPKAQSRLCGSPRGSAPSHRASFLKLR